MFVNVFHDFDESFDDEDNYEAKRRKVPMA
jgi:hypothetical protein